MTLHGMWKGWSFMVNNKQRKIVLGFLAIAVVILIILLITQTGRKQEDDTVKIGFILSGSISEEGWNGMHYESAVKACQQLDAELLVKENVKEFTGECEIAIRELIQDGAKMIILSSYGYSEEVLDVVREYPDIVFYGNSSEYHEDNMTSYFVRMYQVRYLSGILAGMQTETNKIGYVAAMANNEVNRGISAFALGVKRVNPEAEVIVAWTGSWDDEAKEIEAANCLIDFSGVDVLTYHQNQAYVVRAAEEKEIYSIAYHEVPQDVSDYCLTTVMCDWSKVYQEVIGEFLRGKGNSIENFWIGIEKDAVCLSEYSTMVSEDAIKEIVKAQTEMHGGESVFSGVIYDREGNLRCAENEIISDEILLEKFDWYAEGVEFYEE